mgnify:CR=1 FL=1
MGRDLSFLIPELTLAVAAMLMLVAEMLRLPRLVLGLGLAGLAAATLLTFPVLNADTSVFGGTYRIDMLSGWAKLILLPGTALALLLARAELAGQDREGSVYSLLCLVTLGALMLAGGGDMMLLVLGVVLTGLGSFALVSFPRDDAATEAGMKYLVFGSVTGAVMIYGLGYKTSLVPFHFWAPDAYDGAPVSVAAYLSVITKIAGIFAFAQILRDLPVSSGWPMAMALIAAATMTLGYVTALVQTNVVRLLAYSSVAQAGYFLLAIVALGVSPLALPAIVVFGAAYVAMNLGAFGVVMVVGRHLDDFTGIGRRRPVIGLAMVVFLLSLTGIPPLFGFVGKVYLFGAAIEAGYLWLAVIAIANSVLALGVYLRIMVPMYRPAEGPAHAAPIAPPLALTIGIAVFVTLLMGAFAGILPG